MLNTKKTNFKSSTDYLKQTRDELIAFREEVNKEIKDITEKSLALNKLGNTLREEENKINSEIDNSELKLKFH